ncbi:unnamed protein product [Brachionus calyciflorus]|uniref:Uncharacterized protein n=1 Tax=Brachionus calyciflorus TaxID=104777 RepID=A0A813ZVP2_9BILA|nr:unnamed protein product [Brachionus calyciflorus]
MSPSTEGPVIDIKKELALSILNVGEILAKTIDYYSLKDDRENLDELISICKKQTEFEKKCIEIEIIENELEIKEIELNREEFHRDSIPLIDEITTESSIVSNEIEKKVEPIRLDEIKHDKKSSFSLNYLIQEVDKKIKILNGIFNPNEYANLNEETDLKVVYSKKNESTYFIHDFLSNSSKDNYSFLYERVDLYEEMKQLTDIVNDLNFVIDKRESGSKNYGSFV